MIIIGLKTNTLRECYIDVPPYGPAHLLRQETCCENVAVERRGGHQVTSTMLAHI